MSDSLTDSELITDTEDTTDEQLGVEIVEDIALSHDETDLVIASDSLPSQLTILPLSNRPLFPGLIVPLIYEGEDLIQVIRMIATEKQTYIGMIMLRDEDADFSSDNLYEVGVVAKVIKAIEIEGHGLHLVVECIERFNVSGYLDQVKPLRAHVQYHNGSEYEDSVELRAYTVAIINTIKELLKHNPLHEEELKLFISRFGLDEVNHLADFAASLTTADRSELQKVLETYQIFERLKLVMVLLNRELNVSKVQRRIRDNIEERVSDQQRKFFLHEQLREIRRELGMDQDPREQVIEKLKAASKKIAFSEEAQVRFDEEMSRLTTMESTSPEYGMARSYLEWLVALPWGKFSRDRFKLDIAARVLNKHHAGLEDVKDRILEFIAVGARKKEVGGSIILFVGPPGVGKTSLGKVVAEALNRPFYRFSVGGMRDEAEIKGHRRTYIGAMPGKIVQALKQCGSANPVIMIDEVDKIGSDYRGDPASALLEVLDPEQNSDFLDHYLDLRFDLSRVMFMLTANQLDSIPPALLDRAEVIRLPGYMAFEKRAIAKKHLWPRQLIAHGLSRKEVKINDAAIRLLTESYAREPGVRHLEQLLKKILRKTARKLAEAPQSEIIHIGARDLHDYVGKPKFRSKSIREEVGVSTGLAWTAMGGTSLPIEAAIVHRDRRGLKLTGHLGKVMQESADIAL
ncbi:MAG: endopeptidase La, partial [Mariprofundaceae bacterium]